MQLRDWVMAHKYDLVTVDTKPGDPKRHYPWYKERLKQKFLNTSKYCTALNGARWRFVSSNLDDFRSGAPVKSKMVRRKQINPVPIVEKKSMESLTKSRSASTGPGISVRNPGNRTLFSKKGPRQQIKLEHINTVEESLLQHPLALYPHLEDGIASELADDIVDILDPEINELLSSSEEGSISISASQAVQPNTSKFMMDSTSSQQILIRAPSTVDGEEAQESRGDPASIYRFPLIKTEAEKEQEMNLIASQQVVSAKQQSRVKQVTHDLVQWAEELGGSEKSAYIDEQTIKSLFGSNYESKPILMAPIQVVELTSVPPELRNDSRCRSSNTASSQQRRRQSPGVLDYYGFRRSKGMDNLPWLDITVPQVVKSRYGAWYLPVDLWKPRLWDEPLKDPDLEGGELEKEQATRKLEMDEKISALHGAKLFKEFVVGINREASMPSFLKSVMLHTPPPGQARKNYLPIVRTSLT